MTLILTVRRHNELLKRQIDDSLTVRSRMRLWRFTIKRKRKYRLGAESLLGRIIIMQGKSNFLLKKKEHQAALTDHNKFFAKAKTIINLPQTQ